MEESSQIHEETPPAEPVSPARDPASDRRDFLSRAGSVAMAGGLAASYGTLAFMAGRFLYPAAELSWGWMFLTEVDRMARGDSFTYRTPTGSKVAVARIGTSGRAEDFLALSSTCPHLGCQVHWEPQNNRFFCPCHNGVFTPSGEAIEGPPAAARQFLPRFPLKVEKGLLYIRVELVGLGSPPETEPLSNRGS